MTDKKGDYPLGEYIQYDFDKYVWNGGGQCVFDYHYAKVDISDTFIDISGKDGRTPGQICSIILFISARPCGSRCTDKKTSMYMFTFERKGLTISPRMPYTAFFEAGYMFLLMVRAIPLGLFYATFGWFDWYQNRCIYLYKKHMAPLVQSW